MNKTLLIFIGCGLILVVIIGGLLWQWLLNQPQALTACTMEAKLCPDGSYVGRTGPDCEFTPCPPPPTHESWQTATDPDAGISFQYPEKLSAEYISSVDWPPQVQVLDEPFTCTPGGLAIQRSGQTEQRTITNRDYCVTIVTQGAAGSIYTQYAYAFFQDNQTVIFTFTFRATQCGNYDEDQRPECEQERLSFDVDGLVDEMVRTIERN